MELIGLIFIAAVFLAFTLFVGFKYGVQKSISASIYVLKGPDEKALYSLFILFIAIPMMLISDCTIGFWAGALLAIDFAAVATRNDKLQMTLHIFGADAGIGLGIIMLAVVFHQWYLSLAFILFSVYAVKKINNSTWWIETAAMITVWIGLFIEKII